ncbi:MAG: xanthine dehydrogenase family protein molybdopterin-binding subunit [Proteobacteria bacterium]|nr:xanthine dehydrogenase family protein molybdopterin-binding subunit [Pseudomonadota bacterium]
MATELANPSRREFLSAAAAAGGGLLVGFTLPGRASAAVPAAGAGPFQPNAFIRIGSDNVVTLIVSMAEMGQGVLTSLPQLLAEELEADWRHVRFEQAPVDPAYNNPMFQMQGTGGSTSVRAFWDPLRKAGAAAREMLITAAAEQWGVDRATCRAREGAVHHKSGKHLSYGELAARAAQLPVPAEPPLKDPKDFRILGQPLKRLDSPQKVNGSARFGLDVTVPGQLTAVVAQPPVLGARVASVDSSRALAVKGVRHVVQIDSGVAVVADGFWAAKTGRDALAVQWDLGDKATLSSGGIRTAMLERLKSDGMVARHEGDPGAAQSARTHEATYEAPYLAHACMEPMNCTASVTADGIDVWAPTQASGVNRMVIAKVTGVAPEKIRVTTTMLGGGFGRRFGQDFVIAAVQTSKAVSAPVKLVYTREDDMRGQFYRPASIARLRAGLDAAGRPVVFDARIACSSISAVSGMGDPNAIDEAAVEGVRDWPYATPNVHVDWARHEPGVGVWYWRSVGNSQNTFFAESFIDELAHAAGQDPYEYRRSLLDKHPRHRAVLERVAHEAGWGKPLPKGHARGIAVAESFNSYVAEVVEVSLRPDGTPRVHRVVCAVDCGMMVNPGIVRRQAQSAVIFALSAALHGEITVEGGRIQQKNFDDYPVVRMDEAPPIEVHLVASTEKPTGIGEPATPPLAPALANALFALTGKRVRRLPIRPGDLKA